MEGYTVEVRVSEMECTSTMKTMVYGIYALLPMHPFVIVQMVGYFVMKYTSPTKVTTDSEH